MRYVIGLTGGIACGKSAVSNIFASFGVTIIDADVVSRFVMQDGGECAREVIRAFPLCANGSSIDRRKLREIVFSDKEKLAKLNSITHPRIKNEIVRRINEVDGLVLLVVPLLFETGYDKECDMVISVIADVDNRINRLVLRDNIDRQLALEMINSQMSDEERIKRSDYLIENDSTIEELKNKVSQLLKSVMEKTN